MEDQLTNTQNIERSVNVLRTRTGRPGRRTNGGRACAPDELEVLAGVSRMISFIGDNPTREGVTDTPARVVRSWRQLFSGYGANTSDILRTQFTEPRSNGIVICRDIEMFSTCEHHLLPFFGHATLGYLPAEGRIIGLSKLARLVEVFSRRLQNQERLTQQIGNALWAALSPRAVGVVVEATHFCMRARGVQKQSSSMVTSYFEGEFKSDARARDEFLRMTGK